MNLSQSRVGLLIADPSTLWLGTVVSYDTATFELEVSTSTGALASVEIGQCVFLVGTVRYARIKAINVGAGLLTLAENPIAFTAGDVVRVTTTRFPLPMYQRVLTDGTVYKDWDIAWPGEDLAMPPIAALTPEVIVAAVAESVALSAALSAAMAVGASIASYTWTPGTGGAITGSGASVSVAYSTAGFRYLKLTVTDSNGATSDRFVPCWIGATPYAITEARMNWRAGSGWQASIAYTYPVGTGFVYLERTPVVLVDLDTAEVVFYGWMHPQSVRYDFERRELSFDALSALAYLDKLYSYPFLLTTVSSGESDEWAEVLTLTLQRAIWTLLRWHSNVTELANVVITSTARAIQGQEFSAGTLLSQLNDVCKAAFWEPRGEHSGGIGIIPMPLYDTNFSLLPIATLTADEVAGEVTYDLPMDWISEARLMGVYYAGGWQALIVRAPSHPEDIGRPEEVTGLAPLNSTELRWWASRHLALAQVARYDLTPLLEVDPTDALRLRLPDSTVIVPESVSLDHDAEALRWSQRLSGRAYGVNVTTVDEDPPPEVVVPPPDYPPIEPPVPPIPPYEWGDGSEVVLVVNDQNDSDRGHIFRTANFTDTSPVWEDITPASWTFVSGLCTEPVRMIGVKINQVTKSVWVTIRGNNNRFAVIMSKNALTTPGTPTWVLVPYQTATTPPVTYTSNTARHPRVLFDDTLTVGARVAIRMVQGTAGGAVDSDNSVYMIMLDDDLNVISLTYIGSSGGWQEACMVEFNDDATGFLSYHTYFVSPSWQSRRCDVPFGTAAAAILTYCISTNRPAWLENDPLVSIGAGYRAIGDDSAGVMYRLSEASLASGTDDRAKILDFDRIEMVVADDASEQPFARNLGQRPGWLGVTSQKVGYPGLWTATDGATFTVRTPTATLGYLAPRPYLYPNEVPYYAFFQDNFYDGVSQTQGRVYVWLIDAAALSERTGNLHSLVAGALWATDPLCRAPLDGFWGRE